MARATGNIRLRSIAAAAALAMLGSLSLSAQAAENVKVGSKIDTEGSLLGNLIIQVLDANGIKTTNKLQLGNTKVLRGAITAGEIDIYPEYTGNGAFFFSDEKDAAWKNARQDIATANHLQTLADLGKWINGGGDFKLAASAEFIERPDALPAFENAYDFKLKQNQLLSLAGGDTAVTLKAAAEKTSGVNAAMAYGTDGPVAALGLQTLQDPKGVQPIYAPTPIIREAVLKEYPQIPELLKPVFASLDGPTLQKLNAQIAVGGADARKVAAKYLQQKGFVKAKS